MANKDTAIAVVENNLPAKLDELRETLDLVRANLGPNATLSQFDLDKIKVPTGGLTQWLIPSASKPKGEMRESIEGIIVFTDRRRSYWASSFETTGGGSPPDCSSFDCEVGVGVPGGPCASCALSKPGSDPKGDGEACRQSRPVFLLMADCRLPRVLTVPRSSLGVMRSYLGAGLALHGYKYWMVVSEFSLKQVKSKRGIAYAEITAQKARDLDPSILPAVQAYVEAMQPLFATYRVEDRDTVEAAA